MLTYPSDTGHRNSITEAFRHNGLNYLCGLLQILSKICDPQWQYPFFYVKSPFQAAKPSGNQTCWATGQRSLHQHGGDHHQSGSSSRKPRFSAVISHSLENKSVLCYREAKREGKRGDTQVKGVRHAQRPRHKTHGFSQLSPSVLHQEIQPGVSLQRDPSASCFPDTDTPVSVHFHR